MVISFGRPCVQRLCRRQAPEISWVSQRRAQPAVGEPSRSVDSGEPRGACASRAVPALRRRAAPAARQAKARPMGPRWSTLWSWTCVSAPKPSAIQFGCVTIADATHYEFR